jgi:hypothetical protein
MPTSYLVAALFSSFQWVSDQFISSSEACWTVYCSLGHLFRSWGSFGYRSCREWFIAFFLHVASKAGEYRSMDQQLGQSKSDKIGHRRYVLSSNIV